MTKRLLLSAAILLGVAALYLSGVSIAYAIGASLPWLDGIVLAVTLGVCGGLLALAGTGIRAWWRWIREGNRRKYGVR